MLLSALSKAKERAKRIACLNNLKQLNLATLMYSDDQEARFPYSGNFFACWFSLGFREAFHRQYGIQRASFYCPSNPNWNRDDFWNWPDGVNSVFGYLYYVGNEEYNRRRDYHPNPSVFTNQPLFALKHTDNPHYRIVWSDITRKQNGTWKRPGDADPLMRGVNHFNRQGDAPEGSNESFHDGHVECSEVYRAAQAGRLRHGVFLLRGPGMSDDRNRRLIQKNRLPAAVHSPPSATTASIAVAPGERATFASSAAPISAIGRTGKP